MKQDKEKALFIAKKVFAELVFDIQSLEGMPFTMPEVQTYIQGITVGGHKITDEKKLKQQILGWRTLLQLVENNAFSITKKTACLLQKIIAKDEALEIGQFRTGQVSIAGTEYTPPHADKLDDIFQTTITALLQLEDIREQAYRLHLDVAYNQFFYDGNKRTGLLMLNGHLMSNGYPPLSIPAKRLTEYNQGMIRLYETGEHEEMTAFLKECHQEMYGRFEGQLQNTKTCDKMDEDMGQSLEDLETRIVFQERALEKLSEALVAQQCQLDEIQQSIRILAEKWRDMAANDQHEDGPQPPPPHY